MRNYNRWRILTLISYLTFFVGFSNASSFAKMAFRPTHLVKVSALIAELENTSSSNPLKASSMLLLKYGRELLGLEEIRVAGHKETKTRYVIKQLTSHEVKSSLTNQLMKDAQKYWKVSFSPNQKREVLENRSLLKSSLGHESYLWAWFSKGLGSHAEAEGILKKLFEKEYEKIMKLERVTAGLGRKGPMHFLNLYFTALAVIMPSDQLSYYRERLRKAKVHISNIPQSMIMT